MTLRESQPLLEGESRFRALAESAPNLVWSANSDGAVHYLNQHGLKLLGAQPEQIMGDGWLKFLHPEDKDLVQSDWSRSVETGEEFRREYRLRQKLRDEWIWHEDHRIPIRDEQGVIISWVGTCVDVDNRKRIEQALRESERRFRTIVLNAPIPVIVHTDDGAVLALSKTFTDITGYAPEEIPTGIDWFMKAYGLTREEARHKHDAFIELMTRGEYSEREEVEVRTKSGDVRMWVFYGCLPQPLEDRRLLFTSMAVDVTQHKEAEQAVLELNATLEERVAQRTSVADRRAMQLRELAAELTYAEQRERQRLGRILHDHLQQILVAAKMKLSFAIRDADAQTQLGTLRELEELLKSSIEAARSLVVELSPPILHDAGLPEAFRWLARWMRDNHGLKLELTLPEEMPLLPEHVKVFLFEAVRELLLNAVKYAEVPSVQIFMEIEQQRLRLLVQDQGRGFDTAILDRQDTRRSGFGLFSIRERIEAMEGTFEIHSAEGQGAQFILSVPIPHISPSGCSVVRAAEDQPNAGARSASAAGRASQTRVLVVDDHKIVRQGIITLLQGERDVVVVGEAADGEEAVAEARRLHPDLVVMDISMPRLGGVEATRRIKEDQPQIHIIGLSLHEEDDMAHAILRAGATRYVNKSAASDQLCQIIRQLARS